MLRKLKSHWIIFVIFMQKMTDIAHRLLIGLPSLKRSQITAHLYLGGQYNLRGLKKLKAMGITAIVNMREKSIYNEAQYEGFKYLHLPTVDNTPPSLPDLLKGTEFIEAEINNKGKVYIHCRQGLGRGPSMAIAYLIRKGVTYEDAFALVRSVRTFINPRPSQIAQLKKLENYYKQQQTATTQVENR